jgi:long-chain acyl-CoA synthetase
MRSEARNLPLELAARWNAVDERLFRPIRESIGLDQCEIGISGTAPIPPAIVEFLLAIGLPLSESYGLAEATAITFEPFRRRAGTVGKAIPGCEIRLQADQEILVRSGNRFLEYFQDPVATAAAIDAEGWFHTGDLGAVDADGYVRITGRKKELIITSEGRNISPTNVEAALRGASPLIGQCCVIGDDRPFVIALVVLDPSVAPAWAKAQGIQDDLAALAKEPIVRREIERCVARVNATLSAHERVHRFVLLGEEWKPETDVMSPSLKLLRSGVGRRYAAEIDAAYSDALPAVPR